MKKRRLLRGSPVISALLTFCILAAVLMYAIALLELVSAGRGGPPSGFGRLWHLSNTLQTLLANGTARLVIIFLLFVAVQFGFACVYLLLYKSRRDNFRFNTEIQGYRVEQTSLQLADELARDTRAAGIITEAIQALDEGARPIPAGWCARVLDLPSGGRCVLQEPPSVGGGPSLPWFELIDSGSPEVFTASAGSGLRQLFWDGGRLGDGAAWGSALRALLGRLMKQMGDTARKVETLPTDEPNVWSYWDFLYFSTITQTTVGFGDMLPNRTLARLAVVVHLFLGYGLIMVVLNAVAR